MSCHAMPDRGLGVHAIMPSCHHTMPPDRGLGVHAVWRPLLRVHHFAGVLILTPTLTVTLTLTLALTLTLTLNLTLTLTIALTDVPWLR